VSFTNFSASGLYHWRFLFLFADSGDALPTFASWQTPARRRTHAAGRGSYAIRALPDLRFTITSERLGTSIPRSASLFVPRIGPVLWNSEGKIAISFS
jgi:hypothetical protein